jgi:hypothetical protein
VRGVPITIRCDCGDVRPVHYGDRWTCARCGSTWNTAQIPPEEYQRTVRELRRYRWQVGLATAAVLAAVVPLAVLVAPQLFIVAIVVLAGSYFFLLPAWRRRVLERVRERPSWRLRPE